MIKKKGMNMEKRKYFMAGTIIHHSLQEKKHNPHKDEAKEFTSLNFEQKDNSELFINSSEVDIGHGSITDWLLDKSFQKR